MKLLELSLLAFGPFTGTRLDFSSPAHGVHLVYGPNEAGKSTALRAITGLLYGIPRDTRDDHVHRKPDLRIGARLESGGEVLEVVRRKGLRETLLDPSGAVLDETVLKRMLGGVGEDLFRVMFGLDHDVLRRGAQALLEGKGHMGESLFGAALGGGLHDALERLRAEADSLFTPQAHKRPVNVALKAFAEAQRRSRQPLTESTWAMQHQTLEEAIAAQARLEAERRELRSRQAGLRRARLLLPLLAERTVLFERRRELAIEPPLSATAKREREEAQRDAARAAELAVPLEESIASLEKTRASLDVPEALLDLQEEMVVDLQDRLSAYRKAVGELPAARLELAGLERARDALRSRLGLAWQSGLPSASTTHVDGANGPAPARIGAAAEARIRKLAIEHARIEVSARLANESAAETLDRLEAQRRRLAALRPPRGLGGLEVAIASAQRLGDIEARRAELEAEAKRARDGVYDRLRGLGLWSGDLSDVAALVVPSAESIDAAEAEWTNVASEAQRADSDRAEVLRDAADRERDVDELRRAGAPPTEDDLGAARARRDEAWRRLRGALREGVASGADVEHAFEKSVADADEVADRLRREAERVARLARLLADREATERRRVHLEDRARELDQRATAARASWLALWAQTGIVPLAPTEMRAWRARYVALVDSLARQGALEHERRTQDATIDAHRKTLDAAIALAGGDALRAGEPFAAVLARAVNLLAEETEMARRAADVADSIATLEEQLAASARQVDRHRQTMAEWKEAWANAVRPLGLGGDVPVEEATAVLEVLGEHSRADDESERLGRRVVEMQREAEAFQDDVERIVARHAPELAHEAADVAASRVVRDYRRARGVLAEREQVDGQLDRERKTAAEQRDRERKAQARVEELMARAGVHDLAELERAERLTEELGACDRRIAELEEQLVHVGGAGIAALEAETEGLGQADLAAQLEEVEERLEAADDALRKINREIGSIEKGFEDLERRSVAAEAAAEAQQHLARARTHIDRYLRVKLAALLLEREIERYREQNQGPIVKRASELVRRLTLGSVATLRVGYGEGDEPVLRCVREDGRELDVGALSEGTRDQLYLALRLATLERYAAAAEPMPLVADDLFIQFDDDRARAGFETLGEIASTTQVLFFTHHARLLELARAVLPSDRRSEHRLEPSTARAATESAAAP